MSSYGSGGYGGGGGGGEDDLEFGSGGGGGGGYSGGGGGAGYGGSQAFEMRAAAAGRTSAPQSPVRPPRSTETGNGMVNIAYLPGVATVAQPPAQ